MKESLDSHAKQRRHIADSPPFPNTGDETGPGPGGSSTTYPGTPRWVKVFGIILLVLVVLVAIVMVAGGGGHGPGRHMPAGGQTPPIAHGVQQA